MTLHREAPHWITDEIAEMIMETKKRWPPRFKLVTIETEHWLLLHVDSEHLQSFNLQEQIKIAEGVNELCERIRTTGCPTFIQKT